MLLSRQMHLTCDVHVYLFEYLRSVSLTSLSAPQQSGAIMTVLAAVCTKMPEAKLAIIFLPMYTFTAGNVSSLVRALWCRT